MFDIWFAERAYKLHLFVVKTESLNVLEADAIGVIPLAFWLTLHILSEIVLFTTYTISLDMSGRCWDEHAGSHCLTLDYWCPLRERLHFDRRFVREGLIMFILFKLFLGQNRWYFAIWNFPVSNEENSFYFVHFWCIMHVNGINRPRLLSAIVLNLRDVFWEIFNKLCPCLNLRAFQYSILDLSH